MIECQYCKKTFSRRDGMTRHIANMHEMDPEPYRCPECSRSFKRSDNLMRHIKRLHSTCKRSFTSRSRILGSTDYYSTKHLAKEDEVKIKIGDVRETIGPGTEFSSAPEMNDDDKNVLVTNNLNEWTKTIRNTDEVNLKKRNVYEITFSRRDGMTQHITKMHEMDPKLYWCPECSGSFSRKDNLIRHIKKVHSICKRSFTTRSRILGSTFIQDHDYCSIKHLAKEDEVKIGDVRETIGPGTEFSSTPEMNSDEKNVLVTNNLNEWIKTIKNADKVDLKRRNVPSKLRVKLVYTL